MSSQDRPAGRSTTSCEEADNAAVADFITEEVREITADPNASLHVSIAGGRKTMGFYVGYALSLFGRAQDRLSHVLVPPAFESPRRFFLSAARRQEDERASGPDPVCSTARRAAGAIARRGRALFRSRRRSAKGAAATRTPSRPGEADGNRGRREGPSKAGAVRVLLDDGRQVHRRKAAACTGASAPSGDELLGFCRALGEISEQTERAYGNLTKQNFDPAKAHLNGALKRALGERRAAPYLIARLEPIAGTHYHRFGLSLPPEAITIASASLRGRRADAGRRI